LVFRDDFEDAVEDICSRTILGARFLHHKWLCAAHEVFWRSYWAKSPLENDKALFPPHDPSFCFHINLLRLRQAQTCLLGLVFGHTVFRRPTEIIWEPLDGWSILHVGRTQRVQLGDMDAGRRILAITRGLHSSLYNPEMRTVQETNLHRCNIDIHCDQVPLVEYQYFRRN